MFIGELKFGPLKGVPGEFVLLDSWTWVHSDFGRIEIPAGFITDFASTPQVLRAFPLFDPTRGSLFGALPHDWLYCIQDRSRAECDEVLRAALIDGGMGRIAAWIYWASVRAGGWVPWNRRLKKGGGARVDDFEDAESYVKWKTSL